MTIDDRETIVDRAIYRQKLAVPHAQATSLKFYILKGKDVHMRNFI
jgi:hypothetical protein